MVKARRQIYLLNPKKLSPETIAVTFAKTSRSPQSFSEIAAELTDEKSAEFHERWVVGYGHASVAEHAVLHIAIENVSRLAIETIESNRLAAYTEKSTRYQKWSSDAFYTPAELVGHPLLPLYQETLQTLFDAYARAMEVCKPVIAAQTPRKDGESDAAWERRVRTQYIDVCRYLLPAASLANVGMTANARVLEHAIQKLLSSSLVEVQTIGQEIKQVSQAEIPTLVKYAEVAPYLVEVGQALPGAASLSASESRGDWCQMVAWDPQGEGKRISGQPCFVHDLLQGFAGMHRRQFFLATGHVSFPLMVVHDLDIVGIAIPPLEADSVAVVDADPVLPFPVGFERFQMKARQPEVAQ